MHLAKELVASCGVGWQIGLEQYQIALLSACILLLTRFPFLRTVLKIAWFFFHF